MWVIFIVVLSIDHFPRCFELLQPLVIVLRDKALGLLYQILVPYEKGRALMQFGGPYMADIACPIRSVATCLLRDEGQRSRLVQQAQLAIRFGHADLFTGIEVDTTLHQIAMEIGNKRTCVTCRKWLRLVWFESLQPAKIRTHAFCPVFLFALI